jgi:hypothetical protein
MAANRRDILKAPKDVNLPSRKKQVGKLADRASARDFGDVKARPVSPRPRQRSASKQLRDTGVSKETDLPSLFSFSPGAKKRR